MDAQEAITIQATINARVEKVWELYTTPEHVTRWNHASDDWHTTKAENDLRPGGKFLSRMEAKDGSSGFDFYGTYDEIETNKLIVYTLGDGREARVTFTGSQDETCLEVKFEAESTHSMEMQRSGWQAILNNFKAYVEGHHDQV